MWLSEEAFTNSWEAEDKGERERYALNEEFWRIARRDKKVILSEQKKETYQKL